MTPRIAPAALTLAFSLWLIGGDAIAQQALYDDTPPEDAIFVRQIGGTADTVEIAGQVLPLPAEIGTAYAAVSAAALGSEAPAAGSHVSVVTGSTGAALTIEEPARVSASKVHLVVLNATDAPVRLIVPGPNAEVIAAVAPAASGLRAVNPVATPLAVERVADGAILGTFDLRLRRGQDVTFVARAGGVDLVETTFGPVLDLR